MARSAYSALYSTTQPEESPNAEEKHSHYLLSLHFPLSSVSCSLQLFGILGMTIY